VVLGLIGKKIGMTQMFRPDGRAEAVTAVEAGPCMVTQVKTMANDGYDALQIGFGERRHLNKPLEGHLRKTKKLRYLREVLVGEPSNVQVGQQIDASLFQPGDLVDVTGTSKGRGFAGVVKRHGFHGGPKTHGQSDRHRAPGSIGSGTTPGRVLKGLKMAGHMGNARVTVQNLEVLEVDQDRNLLLLKGAVPGARNSLLIIRLSEKNGPREARPLAQVREAPAEDAEPTEPTEKKAKEE